MAKHKFIHWHDNKAPNVKGEISANVHLIVGYNSGLISDFQEMADELRKTFPQATNDQIRAGKIFESRYFKNYSIVAWTAYIPKSAYPGWEELGDKLMEYGW